MLEIYYRVGFSWMGGQLKNVVLGKHQAKTKKFDDGRPLKREKEVPTNKAPPPRKKKSNNFVSLCCCCFVLIH